MRKAGVHSNNTVIYKTVQHLAYGDDIDIIGLTMRDVIAAFSAIERESAKMRLSNSYNFDVVKEFIYFGTAINTNNDVSLYAQAQSNSCQQVLFWSQ